MVEYSMGRFYYTAILTLMALFSVIVLADEAVGTTYLVTEVNDGDTVSIKAKSFAGVPLKIERVRLIGIDAPELRQEPWGRRAKRYLKKLISENGWVIDVEHDIEQRDKHGRLLGYLWTKDRRLLNEQIIEEGFAVLFTVPPNVKHVERLTAAQKRAQTGRRGIWGEGGLRESPRQWREAHPRE